MKHLLLAAAALLALASPAFAEDPSPEAISNTYKSGKPVHVEDVQALMRQAEIWCYNEDSGTCDWAEIYLSAASGPEGVVYDSTNAWNSDTDVSFVDKAQFQDALLCEYGYDKVPSTRAVNRADGSVIGARALDALRAEVYANQTGNTDDCFDYLYVSYDAAAQTMALKQRQYVGGVLDPSLEANITLHFNAADVAGLTQRP
ncbi:MAG: hypothetical protein JWP26_585 [Devosia sp.]|uniref:hypothetical protein n=1 Tax=Devosia sp. TaxID=1871048 RepID=UPI002602915C|nr:hypothetical protein [Devosia sp.]MDB5585615.1 hypothetical protein [Devosia sp.]